MISDHIIIIDQLYEEIRTRSPKSLDFHMFRIDIGRRYRGDSELEDPKITVWARKASGAMERVWKWWDHSGPCSREQFYAACQGMPAELEQALAVEAMRSLEG